MWVEDKFSGFATKVYFASLCTTNLQYAYLGQVVIELLT